MLSLRMVMMLAAGAALLGCGEEKPDALVNDDISWQVGCASAGCLSFNLHDQTTSDKEFKVSCKKGSIGLNVTISDPGSADDNRPASTLTINSLNPATGDCTVSVVEAPTLQDNRQTVTGTCSAGDCTISGAAANGWDFDGTISCDNLHQTASSGGPSFSLIKGGSLTGEPVKLQLDNCN